MLGPYFGFVIGYYILKKTNYKGPNSNNVKKKFIEIE